MHPRLLSRLLLGASLLGLAAWSAPTVLQQKNKTFAKYVEIPGASSVGSETCTACHEATAKNFQHAFHKQQGVECEDCHGNGSLHVEKGGDVTKIISLSKRPVETANGVCLGCHWRDERVRNWSGGSHSANHLRCVDCHQVHSGALRAAQERRISFDRVTRGAFAAGSVSPETDVALRSPSATNDACLKCHQTERAQLSMPYRHPLREGKMTCADCHDPHGGPTGNNLRSANVRELCLSCHAQYRGPFAYQHPPVSENCTICHTAHGSPNTNLLNVSQPALCLQCHAGHHNGNGLPLPDRCTNCHGSIHGTDVPTPSGGSRWVDKGPSDPSLFSAPRSASARVSSQLAMAAASTLRPNQSRGAAAANTGPLGMMSICSACQRAWLWGSMSSGLLLPLLSRNTSDAQSGPANADTADATSVYSSSGGYRLVDGSGFLGRVGEYDSLQQSAGTDLVTAYVSPQRHLTVVSRANVLTGNDYSVASQLTAGKWLQAGFDVRSLVQQQDHYLFYAFPVMDQPSEDTNIDLIPQNSTFAVKRRLGSAYARLNVPRTPIHVFVKGDWQARSGVTQLRYLDENVTDECGASCHHTSRFQQVNYTTRNVTVGADVDLGQVRLTVQHHFSSFNNRLEFPLASFGPFTPEDEPPPPPVPVPPDVSAGNYHFDIAAPSRLSSDSLDLSWTASPRFTFNGHASYTRLRNTFTHNPQKLFDSDETLTWRPLDRLRVIADYHQHNLINNFTPFYNLYGNVSYHNHWEGLHLEYELPKGLDLEAHYRHSGITRSNAFLWPQAYSYNNTDLLPVVPSSSSNTTGLALRYHDRSHWSARAGYEWTGTHRPGYLTIPQNDNRIFANLWLTPTPRLAFTNDLSIVLQNHFPAIPLLRADGNGVPGNFQRRNRFYAETASATLHLRPSWNVGLGYSYQQNNLITYMALQNDPEAGYVLDEPRVPFKQITQGYWGETSYTFKERFGLNLRLTYNSSRSGFRPDLNPKDAPLLGNAALISGGEFDPDAFAQALSNLEFGATQVSQVIVPQWIGQSKVYYRFPHRFEGGLTFYYGSYRDELNPNLNGVLRTFNFYVGRSW